MSPSIWPQMEQILHKHLIELCSLKGSVGGDKKSGTRMHSDKLKQILNSLYEMVVAILLHSECKENFFCHQTRPAFGHLVSLLLEIFSDSTRDTSIRMNAARILEKITDVSHKQMSADSLALILPGFFSKCQKTAIENVNAAVLYQIPQTSVSLITSLICSTMWTTDGTDVAVATSKPEVAIENVRTTPNFQLQIQRDSKWFEMAASKLLPQLSSLVALLCLNNSHHIRLATLVMVASISENCSGSFDKREINIVLLDLCAVLASDSDSRVRSLVEDVLTKLRRDDTNFWMRHMSNKVSKASKSIAKNVKNSSSGDMVFQNLLNCLQVLGCPAFDRLILASKDFLEHLLLGVMQTIRLDKQRLLISSEKSASFLASLPLCHKIQGRQVIALAEFFGRLENVDSVLCALSDSFQTSDVEGRISAAILMTSIASFSPSTSFKSSSEQERIRLASLNSFIDYSLNFLAPLEGCLEAEVNDQWIENGGKSHSDESCLAAVLVHGIVRAALQLKKNRNYTKCFIDVLYEVLKWTSASNYFVKDSAEQSLELLSKGDGSSASVSAFLSSNASYVVFKVSLRCRDFVHNARSPLVLSEMLARCSDPSMFDQVQHIVKEFLLALDRNDQNKTLLLLRAIRNYVRTLLRWFPDLKPVPVAFETFESVDNPERECDGDEDQQEDKRPDFYATTESQEFQKKAFKVPMVESVVAVLNRTKHMISSPHMPIQILVLDILDDSLKFVKNFEDDLLPMIHQNWHGLVRKLNADWSTRVISDSQKLVAARAMEVVETMCDVSGNFVYIKITQELGPRIVDFMRQSLSSPDFLLRTYPLTATYRLQLAVLKGISTIILKCRMSIQHGLPLVEVLKLYSNTIKLPEEMRRAAEESLKRCTEIGF